MREKTFIFFVYFIFFCSFIILKKYKKIDEREDFFL